ncbi:MAG: DNA polymerase I [Alphaproteobacteria bacterium]|nr:MAG: DNA polymerase I [Alphaproteobacteria bacterium]
MTDATTNKRDHLFLVDGSGFIFRAYHALPPMTRRDGTPVNAVYGFCNMLIKLLEDANEFEQPSHFAVIFDAGRKTFRNDIYPEYKAHRPPAPEDLVPQFDLIRQAVKAFNVPSVEMKGFEADDIIATYARMGREAGAEVTIVSSDKDLMQLVGDGVTMLDTMKNRRIGVAEVIEKFGMGPEKVIEIQALAGDSADNVPGVPGIGVKTAALLLEEYGDLETLLARAGEIKQTKRRENLLEYADLARLSLELVTLRQDVPVEEGLDALVNRPLDIDKLLAFITEQDFKSMRSKLVSKYGNGSGVEVDVAEETSDVPIDAKAYQMVTTIEQLDGWIAEATTQGYVAVDTETTSLDAMQAKLVGVSLATAPGKACYIPLGHTGTGGAGGLDLDGSIPDQIPMDQALAKLKPLFEDPSVLKIGQNLKYDILVLRQFDVDIMPFDDTMVLSYVLEGGLHGHGMDTLSELHLGHKPIPFKEVAGTGKKAITFDQVPVDKATEYAGEDADITLRLYNVLRPQLAEKHMTTVYETLDRPLAPILVDMEAHGIKVDRQKLASLSKEFAEGMAVLEKDIHALAGHPFNIASPKQLGEVLFDEMGMVSKKKTGKSGAKSTSADVLEALAADGHEMPEKVITWRQLSKLKGTYTDSLQEQINPKTGRVHTSYAMSAVATGRLASTDPNLQNIPIRTAEGRKIRQAFVPEDGYKLLSADYSQIELRVLAHMADIPALRQAFDDGLDIHAMTASEVFNVPIEGMDPILRRQAKAINFGIIYGISAFGLGRQLGIPIGEAKDYIDLYFERFPGIRTYMEDTKQFCATNGYVETLFGRRVHIRSINDKNPNHRGFAERAAINAPIQGSAADIIRRAMIRMPGAMDRAGLSAKMLLQVHDELIFEVPETELDQTTDLVRKVMAEAPSPAINFSVPVIVDVGVGDNWDEAH